MRISRPISRRSVQDLIRTKVGGHCPTPVKVGGLCPCCPIPSSRASWSPSSSSRHIVNGKRRKRMCARQENGLDAIAANG